MREFKVWDKQRKRFMGDGDVIFSDYGDLRVHVSPNSIDYAADSTHDNYKEDRWSLCQYIGKTDDTPQKNKIYADSSIVEYLMTYTDGCESETKRGVFTYNKINSSYDIRNTEALQLAMNAFWLDRASNFKIIGTLQENPELLEQTK